MYSEKEMEIKALIRRIKIKRVLEWWNNLPIQNLRDPSDSWSGYVMKYYPERGGCYGLTNEEILIIWENEKSIQNKIS